MHNQGRYCHFQMVRIERYKVMVDKDVWMNTKGELVHAKVEVVCLEAQVALLNKLSDKLEQECNEMKDKGSRLRMKDREVVTDKRRSVLRSERNRSAVMHILDEMHSIFKNEGV